MGDVRLTFDDGSVVRLHLVSGTGAADGPGEPRQSAPPAGPVGAGADDELGLPAGFGSARPVSADGRAARALTRGGEALTEALRPLGGVLGGIHRSFSGFAQRPDEVTVEFGVTLGSDLSLGVFSGSGEASFTVSATWNLAGDTGPATTPDPAAPVLGAAAGSRPASGPAAPVSGVTAGSPPGSGPAPTDGVTAGSLPASGPAHGF
ncbi:CU044_2847 family protein [Streptomyces sp. SID161]|uniref:CU044_2847 family protein n=1 Tax=Streptomyces sp. SID161 TaxID=2690251 RepID=UPI001F441A3F|nr:CU044_2847 family protein [Streptomyces sp. SID161]